MHVCTRAGEEEEQEIKRGRANVRVMKSEGDLASWACVSGGESLEDCGGEALCCCVRPQAPADPFRPGGDGAALWCSANEPADMPEQVSRVYDGIFLLLHQSASSTA